MPNLYFTISGFFCIILLVVIFFAKERIKNKETKLFGIMISLGLVDILLNIFIILLAYICYNSFTHEIIKWLNKVDFIYYIIWPTLFALYVYYISHDTEEDVEKKYNFLQEVVFYIDIGAILIEFILPVKPYMNGSVMGVTGASSLFVYFVVIFYLIFVIIMSVKNIKKIWNKKYFPVLLLIISIIMVAVIRAVNPSLIVVPALLCYIDLVMYFTIENPDIKMIEQLNIAKEEAERANRAKTDFLSSMSHEIRTPLNAIVGLSESLADDDIPVDTKEKAKDIIMASNNLLEIVNGILDISKIEAEKLEIIDKEYNIYDILDELIKLTKARIWDKGLDFKVNIAEDLPQVLYGDDVRVKQVILNILTNAVKYTKEGYIELRVSCVRKNQYCRLIIAVEDTGIGIKEQSIPYLFSKFERLDVEKEMTIEGTGLGLAITKKLVELMHGKIVVQSIYGQGSKFTVSIDQKIVSEKRKETRVSSLTDTKLLDLTGYKILIVDDNELNIKVSKVLLSKFKLNIDDAHSGEECIQKINNGNEYDIVFLDDMMPKMSGKETVKVLKQNPTFKTPVIALTANAISGMKEEYLQAGFDDYLSKPIEKNELQRVIKTFLIKKKYDSTDTHEARETKNFIELPTLKKILIGSSKEKIDGLDLKDYAVTIANDGVEVITDVITNKYDLIVLDDMNDMNASRIVSNLNDIAGFKTKIVIISDKNNEEIQKEINDSLH